MKLSLLYGKLLHGKGGTFHVLKVGELMSEGDIEIGPSFIQGVSESSEGQAVRAGETIIRLEFTR